LIVTQYTDIWNDGYISSWDDYQYSYYSTTTDSTSDSSETITSTSTVVTEGTGTITTSSSDSTSTSGGSDTLGYYTTPNNTYNSGNCSTATATSSCTVTRTGNGGDVGYIKFIPNDTLLIIVQNRSSSVLESQVFGNSSGSNTIVVILK